ncbi:4Fe-4S dicluster domain-containing protein [Geotalea uraniireducens]|uniref:4Fe-4S ferredoxin, iron-sulfur binding domain protein n=1 Tax=Geotalea uraniireducens (strain Rf4) TaxID=351605 RepID=A5GCJ8_GEOUR|nr:4Fe-4S dicluster domain-containing protein [Geotalea uraniireducens]ABQ24689.1 4Fe-4S ferredoxin, iron-sulfur binding domain protein [Geotalea uraniireducens Rf4]
MDKDILITMQEDLERALQRPALERRWAMLLDLRKCVGCHACTIGCVSENKLPPKLYYRPVFEYEQGKYPKPTRTYLPRPCMQCDKPPCVTACPVKGPDGATWKETKGIGTGIVPVNYARCIGCGKCVPACPYQARTMDDGGFHTAGTPELQKYETLPSFEYGKKWPRSGKNQPIGNARKCHFCIHRLANGMLPMCITTCIGRAGYFGDESDSKSLIAQVKKANKIQILKAGKGTAPRVYYVANETLEVLYGK